MCKLLAEWLGVSSIPTREADWKHWMVHIAGQGQLRSRIWISGITAMIAWIWRERNARIHGKQLQSTQQLFFKMQREVSLRVYGCTEGTMKKQFVKSIMQ